jgi:hypothetical protein
MEAGFAAARWAGFPHLRQALQEEKRVWIGPRIAAAHNETWRFDTFSPQSDG